MPSHRADTPADAQATVRSRPSGHPAQQRRRDLRSHGSAPLGHRIATSPAGLSWLEDTAGQPRSGRRSIATSGTLAARSAVRAAARTPHRGNPLGTAMLGHDGSGRTPSTLGALALDPLFVTVRDEAPAQGWVVADPDAGDAIDEPTHEPAQQTIEDPGLETTHGTPLFDEVWRAALARTQPSTAVTAAPAIGPKARPSAGRRVATRSARQRGQLSLAPEPSPARRTGGFGVPQVGIVGALGLATIAVPLTGAFATAPPVTDAAGSVAAAAAALAPLPPFPLASRPPLTALDDARLLPDEEPAASVPARLAAPRVLLVGGPVSRSNERSVLPGCNGQVPDVDGVQNGQLPASMLCTLWDPKRQLRSDAAVAIAKLNIAYQQHFGHPMCFTDAYRSLDQQIRVKAERGGFAARPGTSEHGWGLAVDLCDGVEAGASSPAYQWLRENAPLYGWENPKWALPGGAGPFEPWHWEYYPGERGSSSGD